MAKRCTNFSDYADGAPSDWTTRTLGGTGTPTLEVEANANALAGRWLKMTCVSGFWVDFVASWDDLDDFTEGEVLVLIRLETGDETDINKYYGPAARTNAGPDAITATARFTDASEESVFSKVVSGTRNVVDSDTPSDIAFAAGTDYWLRFNFTDGDALKLKYWALGDAEPSAWNHEYDASSDTMPSAAGGAGLVLRRLEPSGGSNDRVYLHFIGTSDDPDDSVPQPDQFHDATTQETGDYGASAPESFNHTRGDLTDGLAVLRVYIDRDGGSIANIFPQYDDVDMIEAVTDEIFDSGGDASRRLGIWYLPLGDVSAGTHEVDLRIANAGGQDGGWTALFSTYNGADQTNTLVDTATGGDDYPEADLVGAPLDSDRFGYLVVDVLLALGDVPAHVQPCKSPKNDGAPAALLAGDVTSEGPATNMWYDPGATYTGFMMAIASFRSAVESVQADFGISSEHLLGVLSEFGIPSEHLREIIEEVLNRKRLWVDLGADVRSIEVEI